MPKNVQRSEARSILEASFEPSHKGSELLTRKYDKLKDVFLKRIKFEWSTQFAFFVFAETV